MFKSSPICIQKKISRFRSYIPFQGIAYFKFNFKFNKRRYMINEKKLKLFTISLHSSLPSLIFLNKIYFNFQILRNLTTTKKQHHLIENKIHKTDTVERHNLPSSKDKFLALRKKRNEQRESFSYNPRHSAKS